MILTYFFFFELLDFKSQKKKEEFRLLTFVRQEKGQDIDGACGQLVVSTKKKNNENNGNGCGNGKQEVDIEDLVEDGSEKKNRPKVPPKVVIKRGPIPENVTAPSNAENQEKHPLVDKLVPLEQNSNLSKFSIILAISFFILMALLYNVDVRSFLFSN